MRKRTREMVLKKMDRPPDKDNPVLNPILNVVARIIKDAEEMQIPCKIKLTNFKPAAIKSIIGAKVDIIVTMQATTIDFFNFIKRYPHAKQLSNTFQKPGFYITITMKPDRDSFPTLEATKAFAEKRGWALNEQHQIYKPK